MINAATFTVRRRSNDRQFIVFLAVGVTLIFLFGLSLGYWEGLREVDSLLHPAKVAKEATK